MRRIRDLLGVLLLIQVGLLGCTSTEPQIRPPKQPEEFNAPPDNDPRYNKPIFMDARNYEWVAVAGAPGVLEKLFGVFTERRSEAGLVKLDAGASHTLRGHGIFLVLSGTGEIAEQPTRKLTTLYLARSETATIKANEASELMHFGLPNLAGVRMPERDVVPAEAAE